MKRVVTILGWLLLSGVVRAESGPPAASFVEVDGMMVHYTWAGTAEPTLVFVHGWACDGTVLNAQVAELARDARCLTIDLPGHGKSDKPQVDYTMHLYARAIDLCCGARTSHPPSS